MPRFIRLYEKKRGDRRTGTKAFGNFGEALFFGVFVVVGCLAFAVMFGGFVWPEWRANRQFAAAACRVVDKQVRFQPATETETATYLPEIHIRYDVDGRTYDERTYDVTGTYTTDRAAARAMIEPFEVGREYTCWYDPIDPHRAVVVRGYSGWLYVLLLVPISFIAIGSAGLVYTLVYWNTSAERLALLSERAAKMDLFEIDSPPRTFPTVPADTNITNSPGTTLAYRLPIATSTNWTLFAAGLACLLWNGIAAVFAIMAVQSFTQGQPDWMLTALVTGFVIAGIGLVVYFARQFLISNRVGPTRVEITDHPLVPGREYEVLVAQAGRLTMNRLEVWLACDERATYYQGTDTRTESRRVFSRRCFVGEMIQINQGLPFESRCQISVPTTAMHSFHANHNEVSWKLIIKGNIVGRPDYERVFQIVVSPLTNGSSPHDAAPHPQA